MIQVRDAIRPELSDGVRVYLPAAALTDSDTKEFVANDSFESSLASKTAGRILLDNLTSKADFIRTFAHVKSFVDVRAGQVVLELGASHGWASVIVKDDCPDAYVVTSDVVPDCVKHCRRYEELLGRQVDEKWAFSVRDVPFADAQFDRIFTFAAFHHFGDRGDYAQTLAEIARVLKPGGKLVLLYEPTSPAFLYKWAYGRANRKRAHEGVDEDVLVFDKLQALAGRLRLTMRAVPFPFYRYRDSVAATLYYFALDKLRLSSALVCTANIVFERR